MNCSKIPSTCLEIVNKVSDDAKDLSTVGDVSEGEADVAKVLVVLLVALHVLPLVHSLCQVHHGQRDFNLDKQKVIPAPTLSLSMDCGSILPDRL